MKKTILFSALIFASANLFSQQRKNDIMFDPILAIIPQVVNISYEHLPSRQFGVGANYLLNWDSNNENNYFSQFSAFGRYYVSDKNYGSGFFVETFIPINTRMVEQKTQIVGYNYYQPKYNKETSIGFGFGFGGKWVTRQNMVFELSLGLGRNFAKSNDDDTNITGKGMFGIGYRF